MASKKTLNATNLAALGADRLAALLLEVTKGDAAAKRRLRLELAGEESPAAMAREIGKRLGAIGRATGFVDWQGAKALIADLEIQRRAIVERLAPARPDLAFDLIWRLLTLSNGLYARADDSSGRLQDFFHGLGPDVVAIAEAAKPDPEDLVGRLAAGLPDDEWGHLSDLIEDLSPLLGPSGLDALKAQLSAQAGDDDSRFMLRAALAEIADATGDVDAFIAQQTERSREMPAIAAQIANRLLDADRIDEAWAAIEAARKRRPGWASFEWEAARIRVFDALGRPDEAQAFRWECFAQSLDADHLRAYLKRLPDFEDTEG
ncbi:MAG: DUF6880 family protein [Pseudomonadota bacterium]